MNERFQEVHRSVVLLVCFFLIFQYSPAADGMRGGVAETQEQPGGQSEDRIISYDYDELNRLTGESADCNGDGYTADYVYDLVGNRLERTITVGAQTLITTSSFDDSDRLESEVHEGPVWAMVVDDRPVYAYAGDGGGVWNWV